MKNIIYYFLIINFYILTGCGKNEIERDGEKIRKEADELKTRLDSARAKIDSGKKELDSLLYRIKKDSIGMDSLIRKLTPFKK